GLLSSPRAPRPQAPRSRRRARRSPLTSRRQARRSPPGRLSSRRPPRSRMRSPKLSRRQRSLTLRQRSKSSLSNALRKRAPKRRAQAAPVRHEHAAVADEAGTQPVELPAADADRAIELEPAETERSPDANVTSAAVESGPFVALTSHDAAVATETSSDVPLP